MNHADLLARLGLDSLANARGDGARIVSVNPSTEEVLAEIPVQSRQDYDRAVERAEAAFRDWRMRPAPERGEVVRRLGEELRRQKSDLGRLVTLEMGKITSEGEGEVQEMIDMCDFATGLSRQLYGLTIASERPEHRLMEQWHPLGPIGVITAFNFPVAVWSWNAAVAAVCGDPVIWKPSPLTPLCSLAVQQIAERVAVECGAPDIFQLCQTEGAEAGKWIAADRRLPLVSATGSCEMGRSVAREVAGRLGRSLLELGGNNALIVTPSANLELAHRAVLFAAVGTAGQRCTTLRRLFVHRSLAGEFTERLVQSYGSVRIGLPWEDGVLMGPLASPAAVEQMEAGLQSIRTQGGEVLYGGQRLDRPGFFVEPTLVRARADLPIVSQETFAPILYVIEYEELEEAIAWQNGVEQGLSSALFTDRLEEAERFLSPAGSDCGIANINIGTSGAEIGGAFGGEKATGGGREAGSDSWKAYMRRQTCTVNYGRQLPLAQGVEFDVE